MRSSALSLAALAASQTNAFLTAPNRLAVPASRTAVRMSSSEGAMSESVPFLPRNPVLDEYPLAADVGFDPANLAKSKEVMLFYRDAEVKHGRLAMLAALGWVVAELFDGRLAALTSEPNKLVSPDVDGVGFAPSVLNGGLNGIPLAYWVLVIALTGALETQFLKKTPQLIAEGKEPGDYSFDPFNLWPEDKAQQNELRTKEVKNGRLAMIAITAFAIQEAVSNIPVVKQTPALFGLTADQKIAGEQIGEVGQVSFNVLNWVLHELHLK